ncbi:MAG TPA: hypothetical protein VL947_06235 [Cytophagales bacterium]|nr:hypothetical protein [Cytophagales bacterium]
MTNYQVDEGWVIVVNTLGVDPLPNATVFNAANLITGKEINVEFLDEEQGYALTLIHKIREEGNWTSDDMKMEFQTLDTSLEIQDIHRQVNELLNPSHKDLAYIKAYGGWCICRNQLLHSADKYNDYELLFFATKNKNFIEVVFHKNTGLPYEVSLGTSKHRFEGITYGVAAPLSVDTRAYTDLQDIIQTIERYFVNPILL